MPAPCPVCGDAGPHPAHLRAVIGTDGDCLMLRCAACDSRFNAGAMLPEHSDWKVLPAQQRMTLELDGPAFTDIALLLRTDLSGARRMLHLGCGFGWAADLARRVWRWDAVGFDAASAADEGALWLGPHIRQELPPPEALPDGPFDVALVTGVLELYEDAGALLAALAARLTPGGRIVATVRDGARAVITPHDLPTLENVGWGRVQFLPTAEELARAVRAAGLDAIMEAADGRITLFAGHGAPVVGLAQPTPALLRRAYLSALVQQTEPGGPVWHGAAGRLLALLVETGAAADALALHAAIEGAGGEPFNQAAALLLRAGLEDAGLGRDPAAVLPWTRRAYAAARTAGARAKALGLDTAALDATARDARAALLRVLMELAPEVAEDLAGVSRGA